VFVLYDSECGFCRWSVVQAARRAPSLLPVAIQSDEGQRLLEPVATDKRLASAHTVGFGGVHSGGDALIDVLGEIPRAKLIYKAARGMPALTRFLYKLVAGRRTLLSRFVPARSKAAADEYLRSSSDPRSRPASPPTA
jgi:predicted DCC family thiol-disulfide oxidoreductase YuxK